MDTFRDTNNIDTDLFKIDFNTSDLLQFTQRSSSIFICDKCNYICKSQSNLKKHERTHSGEKPYACNMCDYSCCDSSNLRKHTKRHLIGNLSNMKLIKVETTKVNKPPIKRKDKPKHLKCSMCEYSSSQEIDIKRHMRTHTGEKPFPCNLCDYRTLDKGNLTKHMRQHTGEYPYLCNICQYACRDSSNFKKHMRTHTGERPYQCHICNFKSACSANLKSHIKTHAEEEKRFSCDQCDYKCMRPIDLKRHIKIHVKRYECEMCQYNCDDLKLLKKHMCYNHTTQYVCTDCGFTTASNSEFKMHIKMHNIKHNSEASTSDKVPVSVMPVIKNEFICYWCNQTFLSSADLESHSESHAAHYLENFKHFLDV